MTAAVVIQRDRAVAAETRASRLAEALREARTALAGAWGQSAAVAAIDAALADAPAGGEGGHA